MHVYGGAEGVEPGPAVVGVAEEATTQDEGEREGLDHMQKVLDDGYEKQDMVKWREAEVIENGPASADERESPLPPTCRALVKTCIFKGKNSQM